MARNVQLISSPRPLYGRRMRTRSVVSAVSSLVGVLAIAAGASMLPISAASATAPPALPDFAAVDTFIRQEVSGASIPGASVVVTRGDQVLHTQGFGHDSEGAAVTTRTLFRIASLSKSFTSFAVMQLVDAGALSLDDPVDTLLEEFRPADPRAADITVRQLLDQTSGLADRAVPAFSRAQPDTLSEAVTDLNSAKLVAAPGTEWNYHNPNYHLAARVVEVASGETFAHYLREHVFLPAGMTSSTTTDHDDEAVDGLADGHVVAYGHAVSKSAPHLFAAGDGGVVSSADDLARWLIVQSNAGRAPNGTRLISSQSLDELHTASAPGGYALGWDTAGPVDAPTRFEHNGNLLTCSAFEAVLPQSGYGVALMFNSSSAFMHKQTAIFEGVISIVEGSELFPAGPRLSSSRLDTILGALTVLTFLLGVRGVVRARRWATRHITSRLIVLRALPYLGVVILAARFPDLAGSQMGGREVTWELAAFGWFALAAWVLTLMAASLVTLAARAWHLGRLARQAGARPVD